MKLPVIVLEDEFSSSSPPLLHPLLPQVMVLRLMELKFEFSRYAPAPPRADMKLPVIMLEDAPKRSSPLPLPPLAPLVMVLWLMVLEFEPASRVAPSPLEFDMKLLAIVLEDEPVRWRAP